MNQHLTINKYTTDDLKTFPAQSNQPHKNNWEELIVISDGQLEHFIKFKKTIIDALSSFVAGGKDIAWFHFRNYGVSGSQ